MSQNYCRKIELVEYTSKSLPKDTFSEDEGLLIYKRLDFRNSRVVIDFPTPKTNFEWRIEPQGCIGHIPVSKSLSFVISPRFNLANLFKMLEFGYKLPRKSLDFLDGETQCQSIEEFYNGLVRLFLHRIFKRITTGLYKEYIQKSETLTYIRGKLDLKRFICDPCPIHFPCGYEEITIDNEENQILLWTLLCIRKTRAFSENIMPQVHTAVRCLQTKMSIRRFTANDCLNRKYNRLNLDYRGLHALCRFFLNNSGPSHEIGDHLMLPFIIKMPDLFELFVSEWLKLNIAPEYKVKYLERGQTENEGIRYEIDIVIYDNNNDPVCVIDTKYKTKLDQADIYQIHTYAGAKHCNLSILVFPEKIPKPKDTKIGNVRVKTIVFPIRYDIEKAGELFLRDLYETISSNKQKQLCCLYDYVA